MGQPYAGQGLMTEAVGLAVPFCFDTLGLHRIHAAFLPDNMASRAASLKKTDSGKRASPRTICRSTASGPTTCCSA